MKKIILAAVLMGMSTVALAGAGDEENTFTPGTATEPSNTSQTFEFQTTADRFVQNAFDFTLSANVAVNAEEDANSMAVVAGNSRGRAVFTGHSNGGSVSQCGALVEVTTGADGTNPTTNLNRLALAEVNGCNATGGE